MARCSKLSKISIPSKTCLIIAFAVSTSCAFSVYAQTQGAVEPARSSWGLGVGVIAVDKPYRDFKTKFSGLPIVSYESRWISASIPTFDLKLNTDDALSFRLRARYVGDGYEASDSSFLSGMEKRKASLWAGGAVILKTDFANFTGEFLADTMGNSKGTRARVQMDRRFAAGKFGITPRVAAEWVDDKYVDYYYGVRQSEVTALRARYEGRSTTNVHAGLRVDYAPMRHHTLFVDLSASRLGGRVKDSPLVDKPNQASIGLGYIYRF